MLGYLAANCFIHVLPSGLPRLEFCFLVPSLLSLFPDSVLTNGMTPILVTQDRMLWRTISPSWTASGLVWAPWCSKVTVASPLPHLFKNKPPNSPIPSFRSTSLTDKQSWFSFRDCFVRHLPVMNNCSSVLHDKSKLLSPSCCSQKQEWWGK